MSKTPAENLVKDMAAEMAAFLKNGNLNPDFITNNLEFNGVKSIQDLETIFSIHFVLSKDIVTFLKKLPERVRRIKTETKKENIRRRGEVRGKIRWDQTITKQTRQRDKTIFVCQNPSKDYNLPENLVLKKLLSVIYKVLTVDLEKPLENEYNWVEKLTKDKDKVAYLKNIYRRNVHIKRIKKPEKYQVTDRHISVSQNSRKELYKDAAKLWIKYRKLMNGDYEEEDLKELLNKTLIMPGETYTLFELYSIFKYLKKLGKEFKMQKIEEGSSKIALFKKDNEKIEVYHDSTGSKSLKFFESIRSLELNNPDFFEDNLQDEPGIKFLNKYRKSRIDHAKLIKNLIKDNPNLYSGRPDMLVEYYENKKLIKLEIGEVKYTENKQTFSQGLKELLEYIYFAQYKRKYCLENNSVKGILFVDKKPFDEKNKLDKNHNIKLEAKPCEIKIYDTKDLQNIDKYKSFG